MDEIEKERTITTVFKASITELQAMNEMSAELGINRSALIRAAIRLVVGMPCGLVPRPPNSYHLGPPFGEAPK